MTPLQSLSTWAAIGALAFIFSLVICLRPAKAFVPSVQRAVDISDIQKCISERFGLPVPATPPRIFYRAAWTGDAAGTCCRSDGQRGQRGDRQVSYYNHHARAIVIYASGGRDALVHELTNDMALLAGYSQSESEAMAYQAEWYCR